MYKYNILNIGTHGIMFSKPAQDKLLHMIKQYAAFDII